MQEKRKVLSQEEYSGTRTGLDGKDNDDSFTSDNIADNKLPRTLLECHWNHARFISRERMWIAGLYSVAWGLSLTRNSMDNPATVLFLFGLGIIGLIYMIKQNYLYEYHYLKAQNYANTFSSSDAYVVIIAPPMTDTHIFSIAGILVVLFCGGIITSLAYMLISFNLVPLAVTIILSIISVSILITACGTLTHKSFKRAEKAASINMATAHIILDE